MKAAIPPVPAVDPATRAAVVAMHTGHIRTSTSGPKGQDRIAAASVRAIPGLNSETWAPNLACCVTGEKSNRGFFDSAAPAASLRMTTKRSLMGHGANYYMDDAGSSALGPQLAGTATLRMRR